MDFHWLKNLGNQDMFTNISRMGYLNLPSENFSRCTKSMGCSHRWDFFRSFRYDRDATFLKPPTVVSNVFFFYFRNNSSPNHPPLTYWQTIYVLKPWTSMDKKNKKGMVHEWSIGFFTWSSYHHGSTKRKANIAISGHAYRVGRCGKAIWTRVTRKVTYRVRKQIPNHFCPTSLW